MNNINPEVILVIGAGASAPFRLPVGSELLEWLISNPEKHLPINRFRTTFTDPAKELATRQHAADFSSALRKSGTTSIDTFLANNPKYINHGKIAIANRLVPAEIEGLIQPPNGWDWIQPVCQYGLLPHREDATPPFGVISFNYDRIFEYAIRIMIESSLPISREEADVIANRIPVVHMYGDFGIDIWDNINKMTSDFRHNITDYITTAADNIRIIPDERNDSDPNIAKAQSLIHSARRIVFLGFGFDRLNLKRLGLERDINWEASDWTEFYASMYKEGDAKLRRVTDVFGRKFTHEPGDCLETLQAVAHWWY